MKVIPNERIKTGGEYRSAGEPCDVDDGVGKALIEQGKARLAQGRPSGGSDDGGKPPSAADLVKEISETEDVERLQELAEDPRKTVHEAALVRLEELGDGSDEGGKEDDDTDPDPDDDGFEE